MRGRRDLVGSGNDLVALAVTALERHWVGVRGRFVPGKAGSEWDKRPPSCWPRVGCVAHRRLTLSLSSPGGGEGKTSRPALSAAPSNPSSFTISFIIPPLHHTTPQKVKPMVGLTQYFLKMNLCEKKPGSPNVYAAMLFFKKTKIFED